jgi:hypothetical protein
VSALPNHVLRPKRPRKDVSKWTLREGEDRPAYWRDLPDEPVRHWGIQLVMRMIRAEAFPKYRQIAPKGRIFWSAREVQAWWTARQARKAAGPGEPRGEGVPS